MPACGAQGPTVEDGADLPDAPNYGRRLPAIAEDVTEAPGGRFPLGAASCLGISDTRKRLLQHRASASPREGMLRPYRTLVWHCSRRPTPTADGRMPLPDASLNVGGAGPLAATTRAIKEQCPDIQVLVLSSFRDQDSVQRAMQAGAIGYLLKDASIDELADGIRTANAGKLGLAEDAARALVRAASPGAPEPGYDLTERQLEILALMVEGLTNNEIAERLVLSPYTVRNHVSEILSRLGTSTRTEAVALAVRRGLVK